MKHLALAAFTGFALMACSPSEPTAPVVDEAVTPAPVSDPIATPSATDPAAAPALAGQDTCGLLTNAGIIGEPADSTSVPAASPNVRHIRPDTQVTMDFRADRLNIDINADGMITGLRCG